MELKVNKMDMEVVMSVGAIKRIGHRWCDLTSFIVNEIQEDNDMGFCSLENYRKGAECFEDGSVLYGLDEDEIWNKLFEITGYAD
ncbi:MAG: hypothetical protein K0Q49_2582, partial [Haloplasmataceae bacterium]|nr:hypothetical protein [Haloplasmataceae bacterium]